jgi:hypothetical protein
MPYKQRTQGVEKTEGRFCCQNVLEQAHTEVLTVFSDIRPTSCDGEDIGVKNDVFWREAHLIHHNPVRSLTNFNLASRISRLQKDDALAVGG